MNKEEHYSYDSVERSSGKFILNVDFSLIFQ